LCLTARLGLKKASAWLQKKHTGKVEERLELSFRTEAKTRLPVVRFAARKISACVFRVTGAFSTNALALAAAARRNGGGSHGTSHDRLGAARHRCAAARGASSQCVTARVACGAPPCTVILLF
jgi:hypothetical protein